MYVERVLAKVRLYTDWKDMTLKNDVTYGDNDKKYTAVKLKKSKDGSEFIQVDGKDVYVIFTGWEVTSTASQSYLFKLIPLGRSHRFGVGIILNIIVHIGQ